MKRASVANIFLTFRYPDDTMARAIGHVRLNVDLHHVLLYSKSTAPPEAGLYESRKHPSDYFPFAFTAIFLGFASCAIGALTVTTPSATSAEMLLPSTARGSVVV